MWLRCIQNVLGTNSGEQKVEAVRLQEVLQRGKVQVNLAGGSMVPVGQRERYALLLSERGCPTGIEKRNRVSSLWVT